MNDKSNKTYPCKLLWWNFKAKESQPTKIGCKVLLRERWKWACLLCNSPDDARQRVQAETQFALERASEKMTSQHVVSEMIEETEADVEKCEAVLAELAASEKTDGPPQACTGEIPDKNQRMCDTPSFCFWYNNRQTFLNISLIRSDLGFSPPHFGERALDKWKLRAIFYDCFVDIWSNLDESSQSTSW